MKNEGERRMVSTVLAQGMRRERQRRGRTLEDVSRASQEVGLKWDQAALSHIETGKRQLTFEEFIAVPVVMTLACGEAVSYADLLNLDDVEAGDAITAVARLAPWLAESQRAVWPGEEWDQLREFVVHDLEVAIREVQAAREPDEEASTLEELRGFADRLDKPIGMVMDAIGALVEADQWLYHSPRREREHRLVDSGEDLSQSGRIRVQRGHITRRMEREIAEKMKELGHGDDQEVEGRQIPGEVANTGRR